jgi:hypothetical protein
MNLVLEHAWLIGIQVTAIPNYSLIDKANYARFAMDPAANISKPVHILFDMPTRFNSKSLGGDNILLTGGMDFKTE